MRATDCVICTAKTYSAGRMCIPCGEAYDRAQRRDDGTVLAALAWAAGRARRLERKRWQPLLDAARRIKRAIEIDAIGEGAGQNLVNVLRRFK